MNHITFYINIGNIESDRYRVFNVIEALIKRGINCRILSLLSSDEEIKKTLSETELVVFFRAEINSKVSYLLSICKERRLPTVFDIDDLIFDTEIPQLEQKDKVLRAKNLVKTLKECDFFTGSTAILKEYGEKYNKPSFVFPNTINYNQFKLAQKLIQNKSFNNDKIKIGYFSGSKTHNEDFKACEKALLSIINKHANTELHIVGHLALSEDFSPYRTRINKVPYMNYLDMLEYIAKIDINIAPLQPGVFNDAKSELKIFESGLVHTPTVASPTRSYRDFIDDGKNGCLASSQKEWEEKLGLLIENNDLRKEIAISARQSSIEKFYIDNCIDDIIAIYSQIAAHNDNTPTKNPKDCYIGLCNSLNLNYTEANLVNLDFLSLLYKPKSSFTGYNAILAEHIKTKAFKNRAAEFIKEYRNKKICFWGAGAFLEEIIQRVDLSGLNITGIIDKNPADREIFAGKYKIYSPNALRELKPDIIIISALLASLVEPGVREAIKTNNLNIEINNIIDLLFAAR